MNDRLTTEPLTQDSTAAVTRVGEIMERFLATADARRVWGEPRVEGGVTLLPAAEVITAAGFGMGSGGGENGADRGGGGGGGGGGHTLARPVAVVVASPAGVRVQPVIDFTKIALAALTAGGFVLSALVKLRRAERRLMQGE